MPNDMHTPQLTPIQKAASGWGNKHWHDGLKIAGADSAYIAFWAFIAGAEYESTGPTHAALVSALESIADQLERIGDARKDAPFIEQARAALALAKGAK